MNFPFSMGAEDCDMTMVILAFVGTQDVVGDIVGVSEDLCGMNTCF